MASGIFRGASREWLVERRDYLRDKLTEGRAEITTPSGGRVKLVSTAEIRGLIADIQSEIEAIDAGAPAYDGPRIVQIRPRIY